MTKEDGTAYDWSATYYPFGEMTQSGAGSNTHGFTGKEFESEMGLNYFCLRYYDPQIGRFMTLDPVEQKGASPYAYCSNNPSRFTDPTGAVREGYFTPIRPQQGHSIGGDNVWPGGRLVKHTREEDLWHEQVMERWTAGRFYLSGFGYNWFLMWEDVDPYLFAGPVHEIVPYDKGALCWDWEIGSWEYYQPWFQSWNELAKFLWSSPNTILGIVEGMFLFWDLPSFKNSQIYFEYSGKSLGGFLMNKPIGWSLGHVVGLNRAYLGGLTEGDIWKHELVHVRQSDRWGPAFLPAYWGASLVSRFFHPWHGQYDPHPFENEAEAAVFEE